MSRRGSAQLLLLFSRWCHGLGRTMAAITGAVFAAGLLLLQGGVSSLAPSEFVHLVRQSAWDRALTGSAEHTPWPWTATPEVIAVGVPRLGLSASLVHDGRRVDRHAANAGPWSQNETEALSTMAIGDRITVTTANGASRVYRVTGRKIVDPHLAESGLGAFGGDAALVTCPSQNSASTLQLVIQGTADDLPAAELKEEQKL